MLGQRIVDHFRRPAVMIAGWALVVVGLILMPVPGPGGTPVFLAGLAILATEVSWARKFLERYKDLYIKMGKKSVAL